MRQSILFVASITLALVACQDSNRDSLDEPIAKLSDSTDATALEKRTEYVTHTGRSFLLIEDRSIGASIVKVRMEFKGFANDNRGYDLGDVDPIEQVFLADLDRNGYEELYFTTKSAGSGSYGTIYGFASNYDKSATPIAVPEVRDLATEEQSLFEGYRGHDKFTLEEGRLVNVFPIYLEGDPNAKPTGGTRRVYYSLIAGEATWILRPAGVPGPE